MSVFVWLPLVSVPVLFALLAWVKASVGTRWRVPLCPVCLSVLLTWVFLLGLFLLDRFVDPIAIAALMGMSVGGIMYKTQEYFQKRQMRYVWLMRLLILLGGYVLIWSVLHGRVDVLVLAAVVTFVSGLVVGVLLQGGTSSGMLDKCC